MQTIFLWIKKYFYPLLLIIIVGLLVRGNYTPGTILSGWDTLHPEFNFQLAFSRVLNGVWRADQGLGAVAIHSHIADLPRIVLLWLLSIVLPVESLRYAFIFLCLIVGPIGVYALTSYLTRSISKNRLLGFTAGLTYLMNLGTLQHFIVPFEMFTVQFAILPWILWTAIGALDTWKKRWIIGFALFTFIASPQAYAATLFYAFLGSFILFLFSHVLLHLKNWATIGKRAIVLLLITFIMNAYWLLPNIYAAITHSKEVQQSKQNRLFSPEAYAKNQTFGTVDNAVILKNFLFDWQIYRFDSQPQKMEQMMKPWEEHLKNALVTGIGYSVFALSIIGIVWVIRFKQKTAISLLPIYVFSFLMLLNGTYPVTILFNRLDDISPVLSEALRFPYTKFSILFMTTMSIFVAYGIQSIFTLIRRLHFLQFCVALCYSVVLFIYFLPAFTGNLIHPSMQITYPKEYQEMFEWFTKQDRSARVGIFPINSFWNWTYYEWGYQGSGFLQFGIPQPILDRDYDRWSPYNEQYQREMAYAVYSMRPELLRQVLTKYNVQFVLIDDSVMNIGGRHEAKFVWALPGLLSRTGIASEVAKFGEKISVYSIDVSGQPVTLYTELPSVGMTLTGGPEDTAYSSIGPYMTKNSDNQLSYPFRNMFTYDERFTGNVTANTLVANFSPALISLDPLRACRFEKLNGTRGIVGETWRYTSVHGSICDHFALPQLPHERGYVLEITHRNVIGFPLQICVSNTFNRRCDLFTHLRKTGSLTTERFLIPPLFDWNDGYTVDINNFAVNGSSTVNELAQIRVYEVDYWTLSGQPEKTLEQVALMDTKSGSGYSELIRSESIPVHTAINGRWYYKTKVSKNLTNGILVLDQSYENGWKAIVVTNDFPYFKFLNDHVLANNWANGWILTSTLSTKHYELSTIYLFFLPQLFEWFGFALLPLPFIWVLKKRHQSPILEA